MLYISHSDYVSQKLHNMEGDRVEEPSSPLTESKVTYNTDSSNTSGGVIWFELVVSLGTRDEAIMLKNSLFMLMLECFKLCPIMLLVCPYCVHAAC